MSYKLKSFLVFLIFLNSCKEHSAEKVSSLQQEKSVTSLKENRYPASLEKVFHAHGGLNSWKGFKTLEYSISKDDYNEKHTVSLSSRKDIIKAPDYSLGFDGENVWKLDVLGNFKGDAVFYHNLFFYFYAMPFVLADEGITYAETPNLEFKGVSYPGVKISYDVGVGTSFKDNYYLHYHPETYKMEWLGYTVTYRSGETSNNIKWIRYNDWQSVEKMILPKSITWYSYEGREIQEAKKTMLFSDVKLYKEEFLIDFFVAPKEAIYVMKK
ncbi:DUF6503 family protein [uncultured Maribacter sp.]|uniref:DUF6503 family protein n=1 Tax=uncultured Maribacter sp. TaxID=431308 RepID=UPI00262BC947|nr:DUF6503 family protein [uncultured Maribacter sp.]